MLGDSGVSGEGAVPLGGERPPPRFTRADRRLGLRAARSVSTWQCRSARRPSPPVTGATAAGRAVSSGGVGGRRGSSVDLAPAALAALVASIGHLPQVVTDEPADQASDHGLRISASVTLQAPVYGPRSSSHRSSSPGRNHSRVPPCSTDARCPLPRKEGSAKWRGHHGSSVGSTSTSIIRIASSVD
jgi:hypothetical protein